MHSRFSIPAATLGISFLLTACNVGPPYHAPTVQTPTAYKELTSGDLQNTDGWKLAQPRDAELHGNWWELFGDTELNRLEEQVNISNQNIAAAAASYAVAGALVKEARSQLFPRLTTSPSITESRVPARSGTSAVATGGVASGASNSGGTISAYSLPFDASWEPDLWGRIQNTVRSNVYGAQASAADLENARLSAQAEVALDYFSLRDTDTQKLLLDSTSMAYRESVELTRARYETGIASEEDLALAQTQVAITEAQATGLGVQRAQFEHAIGLLLGQPASSFSIPEEPLKSNPPAIPFGVPSDLLERRPDIASAERHMAAANAQIGIAQAAYYPTLTLNGSAGVQSSSITTWLSWPSRFWSVGTSLAQTLFDAGLRRATVQQFRAGYDENVANYRQTVLTAFEQVENALAALRILSAEGQQQVTAVTSSERVLTLATDRYRFGIDPYLNVITAQATLLNNQRTLATIRMQQMSASVQLIESLGGGWNTTQLPSASDLTAKAP